MGASSKATVGLIHPGAMGATIGAAAGAAGCRVAWASKGRGRATGERAAGAGLADAGSVGDLVRECEFIIAVCPPHAAPEVAREVAGYGFDGTYVDANAVSPATARGIGTEITKAGARYVDGGIIGPPAIKPGITRLYLSGSGASEVAALFTGSLVDARAIGDEPGAASALKMSYASWTKGSNAMLLAVRALAAAEGVEEALLAEWGISQPGLVERSEAAAPANAPKGWRFVGEMHEIADTFAGVDLPRGFHEAAAEIYRRLEEFKERDGTSITLEEVVKAICDGRDSDLDAA